MCGRYAPARSPEDLTEEFEVEETEGNGPGDSPAAAEADYNVWKSSSSSNRMTCEKHLNDVQKIHAELIEKFKKDGVTLGPKDFVCLPKGMHP